MSNWKTQVAASAVVLTSIAGTEPSQAETMTRTGPEVGGMFIKIDTIQGESTDSRHKGEIDVLAWSWGVASNSASAAGKTIKITKSVDKASAKLAQAAAQGDHIKTASLVVRKSGSDPTEFVKRRSYLSGALKHHRPSHTPSATAIWTPWNDARPSLA